MWDDLVKHWNKAAANASKSKHPAMCDLCGRAIEEDDKYYLGCTHYNKDVIMWAYTCLDHKCTCWLVFKELRIKRK